jgi:hypothetical protein
VIIATRDDLLNAPTGLQQQFAWGLLQDSLALARFGLSESEVTKLVEGYTPPLAPVMPKYVEPEPVVMPDWDGFIQEMLTNPDFNQAIVITSQNAPALAFSFSTVFAQAATNLPLFLGALETFKQVSAPSSTTLEDWAKLSKKYNLPSELIEGILQ